MVEGMRLAVTRQPVPTVREQTRRVEEMEHAVTEQPVPMVQHPRELEEKPRRVVEGMRLAVTEQPVPTAPVLRVWTSHDGGRWGQRRLPCVRPWPHRLAAPLRFGSRRCQTSAFNFNKPKQLTKQF